MTTAVDAIRDMVFYRKDAATAEDVMVVDLPIGGADARLARYGALLSVDFSSCIQTKARSMSSLPFTVVRDAKPKRVNMPDHPIARLLNGMANPQMTSSALMAWTTLRRDTFGNAYWYIEWDRGVPVAIWPVNAHVGHDFKPENPRGMQAVWTVSGGDEHVPAGTYFSDEIVNIPTHVTKDGIKGMSLATLAADAIGLSVDLARFYRTILNNGNWHVGHVEVPLERTTKEALDAIKVSVKGKSGMSAAGEAPVFGYGAKWVNDPPHMKEVSLVDEQRWVLHEVCRACNVPPWKVYDGEQVTYNGGQQMRIDYVSDTIVPDVRIIELALKPVLDACSIKGCTAKFNINGLMRGDDQARTAYYRELGYLGAITREDVREKEDLEPIDGLDKPLFPLNYGTVNPDGSVNVFSSKEQSLLATLGTGVQKNVSV